VLRIFLLEKKRLLLAAPTNWGKSNVIVVSSIFSALSLVGWGGKRIMCIVPNVVVLLTVMEMVAKLTDSFSYCTPGYGKDEKTSSEQSLTSGCILNIWTPVRVSCWFLGTKLHPLHEDEVRRRIVIFQQNVSCLVIDEAHIVETDKFDESTVLPKIFNEVSK
jgi:hypothetical protein